MLSYIIYYLYILRFILIYNTIIDLSYILLWYWYSYVYYVCYAIWCTAYILSAYLYILICVLRLILCINCVCSNIMSDWNASVYLKGNFFVGHNSFQIHILFIIISSFLINLKYQSISFFINDYIQIVIRLYKVTQGVWPELFPEGNYHIYSETI